MLPKFPQKEAHINTAIEDLETAIDCLKRGHLDGALLGIKEAENNIFIFLFHVAPSLITTIFLIEMAVHYFTDMAKVNINQWQGWGANTSPEFWYLLGADQLVHSLTYVWILWVVNI